MAVAPGDAIRPRGPSPQSDSEPFDLAEAELVLAELASAFLSRGAPPRLDPFSPALTDANKKEEAGPTREDMYRVLVDQIPAVVFIAYLDRAFGEAYVSPQIESVLGFSQEEWLDDPIRWYRQIHPEDKYRWSIDAARLFVTGEPLRSAYRVMTREGRVVWFHCEAKMVRREDGRPWFLHGVGFDITELKQAERTLQERTSALQNLSSRLLQLQDEERRRIARELHDSLGQYLAALKINLDLLGQSGNNSSSARYQESLQILDQCISETRTLSHLLHPPLLDEAGLLTAVQWYVEGFSKRSGIKVSLDTPFELERLPETIEIALFRVLQEALTNVHRHSESREAEIHLEINQHEVSLQVRDHGHGIPAAVLERFHKAGNEVGVGLSGMRERVNELGGHLQINSGNQGTLVSVSIPVERPT
jgi:PAS domain S-box-containing protein